MPPRKAAGGTASLPPGAAAQPPPSSAPLPQSQSAVSKRGRAAAAAPPPPVRAPGIRKQRGKIATAAEQAANEAAAAAKSVTPAEDGAAAADNAQPPAKKPKITASQRRAAAAGAPDPALRTPATQALFTLLSGAAMSDLCPPVAVAHKPTKASSLTFSARVWFPALSVAETYLQTRLFAALDRAKALMQQHHTLAAFASPPAPFRLDGAVGLGSDEQRVVHHIIRPSSGVKGYIDSSGDIVLVMTKDEEEWAVRV